MAEESNDEDLQIAVGRVFDAYDTDKSGTLDMEEVLILISDALQNMNINRSVTQEEVEQFIGIVDKNGDRNITKN